LRNSVPRNGLDDIAEDLGFGRVSDYRLAVLEDDLVVAQITKSILPFLRRSDGLAVLALDQLSLILGAHLLQRYGVLKKTARCSRGGLAPWQKRGAIAAAKNLVNQVSLPSADRLLDALNSFQTALTWTETQRRIQALLKRGLQSDGDFESRWPAALDTLLER
jgi:hypothetical protein